MAPNLITLIGFTATVLSASVLILQDLNCEGKVVLHVLYITCTINV